MSCHRWACSIAPLQSSTAKGRWTHGSGLLSAEYQPSLQLDQTLETSCKPSCWPGRPCPQRGRAQLGKFCLPWRAPFPLERWASYSDLVFGSHRTPSFPSQHLLPSTMFSNFRSSLFSSQLNFPLLFPFFTLFPWLALFIRRPSGNSGLLFMTYVQLLLK